MFRMVSLFIFGRFLLSNKPDLWRRLISTVNCPTSGCNFNKPIKFTAINGHFEIAEGIDLHNTFTVLLSASNDSRLALQPQIIKYANTADGKLEAQFPLKEGNLHKIFCESLKGRLI